MNWTIADFVIAGALIFSALIALQLVKKHIHSTQSRIIAISAIAIGFILAWIEGAVGIVGEGSPFGILIFFVLLGIALITIIKKSKPYIPDSTAVRVALWRTMHVQNDPPPHIIKDEIGLELINPDPNWKQRPDMHPQGTAPFRASIIARARFIEDLVIENQNKITQYVMLGAGLDTFAQRHPEILSKLKIFEIDKPDTIKWKQQRLKELNYKISPNHKFVPYNFESKTTTWKDELIKAGFNPNQPAIITSIGVSMYLTHEAIEQTLKQITTFAPNSIFIMTFMLPIELVDPADQPGYQMAITGAQKSGTPFISFFSPDEMHAFARKCGFEKVEHLSTASLASKYFSGRSDGLKPSTGEEVLIAEL